MPLTPSRNTDQCSNARIGYNPALVMNSIAGTDFSDASENTAKGLTRVMVLHPVATGLCFIASDQEWRHGDGPEITGTSEAIAMAVSGRPAALDDLAGPGLAVLRPRVAPSPPAGR